MEPMKKLIVILAFVVGHARAEAQSATAQAETLFRQGKDLLAHGKTAEACAAFDASQKLEPTIATTLNQASCREKNGQLATAWGLFLDAERQSRAAADDAGRKLHQVATDHATALERKLSTLTVAVPAENRVRGLEILRNGEPLDPGAWGKALPVDGGTYKITARAPGNAEWTSSITVAPERDVKTIETPKLKAVVADAAPHAAPASEPAAPRPTPRPSRVLPIALGASAVALGAVALGFELSARSTYDKVGDPGNDTDAKREAVWHSANNRRYAAEGLGLAGLACAGAAVFFFLHTPSAEEAPQTALRLGPAVSPTQAGLVLTGGF